MRYLLDTHVFVGIESMPELLSPEVVQICRDPRNELFLSYASVWEMQIKIGLGKLTLVRPLHEAVRWQQDMNALHALSITLPHIYALTTLPNHHRDPFDRLLIAQAQVEDLTLLSRDEEFKRYPITVIW